MNTQPTQTTAAPPAVRTVNREASGRPSGSPDRGAHVRADDFSVFYGANEAVQRS